MAEPNLSGLGRMGSSKEDQRSTDNSETNDDENASGETDANGWRWSEPSSGGGIASWPNREAGRFRLSSCRPDEWRRSDRICHVRTASALTQRALSGGKETVFGLYRGRSVESVLPKTDVLPSLCRGCCQLGLTDSHLTREFVRSCHPSRRPQSGRDNL
ncbi:unnamed protein product [Protopolystoma xenopodis]|uniref:Uncharacterized protein n=1 Tax=Protopolystoma xenopodis TaxID=117903 RepID=A0A3S5FCK0_9PLAT|nr:unnamed protein product [Protopolystoma xenopodis]